jgi:hypothetical protein
VWHADLMVTYGDGRVAFPVRDTGITDPRKEDEAVLRVEAHLRILRSYNDVARVEVKKFYFVSSHGFPVS